MGAKRTGRWKYLFLYLACGTTFLMMQNGCRSHMTAVPDKDASMARQDSSSGSSLSRKMTDEMTSSIAPGNAASVHLDAARLALAEGNYLAAALEIEMAAIENSPLPDAETIFLTGLLYAAPGSPTRDMHKARETFLQIEKEHPDADRTGEVRILMDLLQALDIAETENQRLQHENSQLQKKLVAEQNSVQRLKNLINKLKEIDLGLMPEDQ